MNDANRLTEAYVFSYAQNEPEIKNKMEVKIELCTYHRHSIDFINSLNFENWYNFRALITNFTNSGGSKVSTTYG